MTAAARAGLALTLLALDAAVVLASFVAAYWLRFGTVETLLSPSYHRPDHLILAGALLVCWISGMWFSRHYRIEVLITRRALLPRIALIAPAVGIAVAAALFLFQAKLASRLVFGYSLVGTAAGAWLVRRAVLALRRVLGRRSGLGVLVVGTGELGAQLGRHIEDHPELGYHLIGYLSRAHDAPGGGCQPVLGTTAELESVLDRHIVDQVVVAAPMTELADSERVLAICDEVGVDVSMATIGLGPRVVSLSIDELGGTQLLRLVSSPQFRAAMVGKRCFDLVCASILLVLAAPLMVITALAVAVSSKGPVLFVQERVGLNGRRFSFLKFRTMVDGAHDSRAALESDVSGPVFKMRRDPRVTRVGRLLRLYSIDELPQLLNVLAGHMSLVGPRPPLPEEVERYDRWQLRRLSVKPGITCTWQVSGRSEIAFEDWMRLDLAYIDNWSPWLDLKILARTIPAVLSRRGAS